ncbi:MAG: hypothetical protein ACE5LF_03965 [Alphaproteobacteria bacterium]
MTASRNSGVVAAAVVAALAFVTPLAAQISGPLDIVPQTRAPEPPPEEEAPPPSEPAAEPAAEPDEQEEVVVPGVEVTTVTALDPEAIGLYEEAEGGFGFDMWRGSPRALVERLLPQLPAGVTSRAINALARRLLLSSAAPPEGPRRASLTALRVGRLAAMGEGVALNHLLRAAPQQLHDAVLARARLDALLLTADHVGACGQARELVRSDESPYWDKVLIFCQALNGQHDAAALGVALLRERGADDDPAFRQLLRALAGESDIDLSGLSEPTALHLAMLNAARVPAPESAVESASPAIARAVALTATTPLELRLRAAERAEAMGVLPTETLVELYASVAFTTKELANPLTRAKTDQGPMTRALLYQALRNQVVPAARAEVLRACWRLGRESDGWDGFATAARATLDSLLSLTPSPEIVWIAGDAARALLAAGRPDAARAWFELAQGQASANAEAKVAGAALWPLIKLADGEGLMPWEPERLVDWWQAQRNVPADDRRERATVLYGLLAALGEDVPVDLVLDLVDGPVQQWSKTLAPGLAQRLAAAAAEGRIGETVLLALVALDPSVRGMPGPLALDAAVSALVQVGLEGEARAVALETALALDL